MSKSEAATGNGVTDKIPEHVRAERVEINQGGANTIEATTVSLQQAGAARVRAHEMTVAQSGVVAARTDSLRLGAGANGLAVVADEATIEPGASVFVLIARRASGDVRPVLDWRAAAAFGLAVGLVLRLLGRR